MVMAISSPNWQWSMTLNTSSLMLWNLHHTGKLGLTPHNSIHKGDVNDLHGDACMTYHKQFPQESYQNNNKQIQLVADLKVFLLDTRDTVKVFESFFFTLVTLGFKGIMLIACWEKKGKGVWRKNIISACTTHHCTHCICQYILRTCSLTCKYYIYVYTCTLYKDAYLPVFWFVVKKLTLANLQISPTITNVHITGKCIYIQTCT